MPGRIGCILVALILAAVFLSWPTADVMAGEEKTDAGSTFNQAEACCLGSYRIKDEAQEEAKSLIRYGWPARVVEVQVQGVTWYRVYGLPRRETVLAPPEPPQNAESGEAEVVYIQGAASPGPLTGFEILVDLSGSTGEAAFCQGLTKHEAEFRILEKIGQSLRDRDFTAAMRSFGYRRAWSHKDYTRIEYGPRKYDLPGFSRAVDGLAASDGTSPLGFAIGASETELGPISGWKALIILSDFKPSFDFGDPLDTARDLGNRLGALLCFHTIDVGPDEQNRTLAREIARIGVCGGYFDGCRLLGEPDYFEAMIEQVFGRPEAPASTACPDADGDRVCDADDRCPDTPKGISVDERGCWVAATSEYFDLNQASIKKEFLPLLRQTADFLMTRPGLTLEIAGFTDNTGTPAYNLRLGSRRAAAVRDRLVKFGVASGRLRVQSYGESRPAADNSTAAGRAKNRRVEIRVLPSSP